MYKLLWILSFFLLLRNFYYAVHSVHTTRHFIAHRHTDRCPNGKTGEKVWKAYEKPSANEERETQRGRETERERESNRVSDQRVHVNCATHSKELCRILVHFSSRLFSICCFWFDAKADFSSSPFWFAFCIVIFLRCFFFVNSFLLYRMPLKNFILFSIVCALPKPDLFTSKTVFRLPSARDGFCLWKFSKNFFHWRRSSLFRSLILSNIPAPPCVCRFLCALEMVFFISRLVFEKSQTDCKFGTLYIIRHANLRRTWNRILCSINRIRCFHRVVGICLDSRSHDYDCCYRNFFLT